MTCISPPEPEDWFLMAFLDGDADPDTILHLKECQHCRDRVASLAREQQLLSSRFFRITCPSATELGEYHLRVLPSDQMLVISQHLRDCPYCTQEISQLEEFLSDLGPGPETNLVEKAKVLVARLVGGRASGEPAFALRGESQGPVIFEAEGVVIILDMQPADEDKVNILGQVAADDQEGWTGATVKLEQTDGYEKTESVDDLGAFRFEKLFAGSAKITITSPHGIEVQIPNIDIHV